MWSLISGAEAFFTEEVIDLEKEEGLDDTGWIANRIAVVEKEIRQLTKEIQERDRRAFDRRVQDSLVRRDFERSLTPSLMQKKKTSLSLQD
jgi:hypothetical protein